MSDQDIFTAWPVHEREEDTDAYVEEDNTGTGSDTENEPHQTIDRRHWVKVKGGDPRYLRSPWRCARCEQSDCPCVIDHAQGRCVECANLGAWCNMSPVPKSTTSNINNYPALWLAVRLWYHSMRDLLLRDPDADVPPPKWAYDESLLPQKAATLNFSTPLSIKRPRIQCKQEVNDRFIIWAAANPDRYSSTEPRSVAATTNSTSSNDVNGKRKANPCVANESQTNKRLRSNGDQSVSQGLSQLSRVVPPTPSSSSSSSSPSSASSSSLPLPRQTPRKRYVGTWPPVTSTAASSSSSTLPPPLNTITLPITPPPSTIADSSRSVPSASTCPSSSSSSSSSSSTTDPASELTKSVMASLAMFQTQATQRLEASLTEEKAKNATLMEEIVKLKAENEKMRAVLIMARECL